MDAVIDRNNSLQDLRRHAAKLVRDKRRALKLSQYAIGALVGVSRDKISNYETGRTPVPAEVLLAIMNLSNNPPISS